MKRDIKAELDYLKQVKRKEVREKINEAQKFCDVHEDASYKDFIDEQYRIETKIKELETKLLEYSSLETTDYALLNHKIKINWLADDLEETYCLVSPLEANIEKNYLSIESPLGAAIANAKPGDIVRVNLPNGKERVKIETITLMENKSD